MTQCYERFVSSYSWFLAHGNEMINYCIISDFVFLFTGQLGVGAAVGITIAVILPTLFFLGLVFGSIFYVYIAGNTTSMYMYMYMYCMYAK